MPRLSPEEHKLRKERTALRCLDSNGKPINEQSKSVAVQDKKDSCDINKIVAKYNKTGSIEPGIIREGRFGDFTAAADYQESMNRVIRMQNEFMALDPKVREFFKNDPTNLIAFLQDEKNEDKAIELGLLPQPKIERKKVEEPNGVFWVTTRNGKEIERLATDDKGNPIIPPVKKNAPDPSPGS